MPDAKPKPLDILKQIAKRGTRRPALEQVERPIERRD